MFDLNENNWKPKSTGEGFWELDKMLMTGTIVQDIGNSFTDMENRRQTRRNSVGSVEELYNEIEKSIAQASKRKSFQRFWGIWTKQL
jgi:hypothetical protein